MATKHKDRIVEKARKDGLDKKLDKALKDSFPASDPPAVGQSERAAPDERPVDRKPAKIDHDLVKHLAEKVDEKQKRQQR